MGISAHEMLLVLRARDEASRVLRQFGGNFDKLDNKAKQSMLSTIGRGAALTTVGVGIAAAGIKGMEALNRATDAAIAYNAQAALTKTQVDKVKISLSQLEQMGINVGNTLPVAFEQIQPTLYDIFSSIDTNAPGAAKMLRDIGIAAVGGGTDMQTAGRAIIGILNAFKMTAKDTTHVNDVLFQLVRKGVGTFTQFGTTIGRAVPSAVKAGQTVESLAGMLAFLTRNGLSAAMASASAARALDALANPKTIGSFREMGKVAKRALSDTFGDKVVKNLERAGVNFGKMGVNVLDSSGKMKPVVQIMAELNKNFVGFSKAQKAVVMHELLKGSGGTIQAMRFFNHALNDTNKLLPEMTKDMNHAGGSAKAAFDIMSNTPAAKIQLLRNKAHILALTIGKDLIPVKMALVKILTKVVDWFNRLSPATQKLIIKILAFAAVAAVIIGVVMAVVGVFMILGAVMAATGITLGGIALVAGIVIAAIAAIVVAVILLIKYWKQIREVSIRTWNDIRDAVMSVVGGIADAILKVWNSISDKVLGIWNTIWDTTKHILGQIRDFAVKEFNRLKDSLSGLGEALGHIRSAFMMWLHTQEKAIKIVRHLFDEFVHFLQVIGFFKTLMNIAKLWAAALKDAFSLAISAVKIFWGLFATIFDSIVRIFADIIKIIIALINGDWKKAWHAALDIVTSFWDIVAALFTAAWHLVVTIVKNFVKAVIDFFKHLYDILVGHSIIPDLINGIVKWFLSLPGKILAKLLAFIDRIVAFFKALPGRIMSAIGSVTGLLLQKGKDIIQGLWNGAQAVWRSLSGWLGGAQHAIAAHFSGAIGWLLQVGKDVIHGLWNGLKFWWDKVTGWIGSIAGWIKDHKGPISLDRQLLYPAGKAIMHGLVTGLMHGFTNVVHFVGGIGNWVKNQVGGAMHPTGSFDLSKLGGVGAAVLQALNITGAPISWLEPIMRRIAFESGGNPTAINLTDINARQGDPSRGLMQTIMSTFRAYHQAGTSWDIYDPVANIAAAINYIKSRYGSIFAIDPPIQGYASGAWNLATDQLAKVHRREMIVPADAADKFRNMVDGGGKVAPVQNFYITTQEIDPRRHAADLGWEIATRVR